jgi:hypothetical protein
MEYSSDSERPRKRLKRSSLYEPLPGATLAASATAFSPLGLTPGHYSTAWSPQALQSSFTSTGTSDRPTSIDSSPRDADATPLPHPVTYIETNGIGVPPAALPSDFTLPPSTLTLEANNGPNSKLTETFSAGSSPSDDENPLGVLHSAAEDNSQSDMNLTVVPSPFNDCVGTFGSFRLNSLHPPSDGYVDGYIKFRWRSKRRKPALLLPQAVGPAVAASPASLAATDHSSASPEAISTALVKQSLKAGGPGTLIAGSPSADFSPASSPIKSEDSSSHGTPTSDFSTDDAQTIIALTGPRLLPSQFGFQAKMRGPWDRRFWEFYTRNWCPGRTAMRKTNLWLNDFARMHQNSGVRAAIQALAGVYIYDYMPTPKVRQQVNEFFKIAESRLTELINYPTDLDDNLSEELITIATLLSMQDIVLIERRLKKPYYPRWLLGFSQAEACLRATDPGTRFWHANNVQLSTLRISQSIIVGRAIILAQPMMPLVHPRDLKPQKEATRFDWLLYGTESEMFEIHGGCGFSKKLLHAFGQITYCAARMHQEPESPITPMTAQFLLRELESMRQWTSETSGWEGAKGAPQPIEWIRTAPEGFRIMDHDSMTIVTAEAWRLAAVIYLQCRALR